MVYVTACPIRWASKARWVVEYAGIWCERDRTTKAIFIRVGQCPAGGGPGKGRILKLPPGQIDAKYKFQNWGKVFPGSSIDVYEWVEADVVPSQYVAAGLNGVPKDIDDSLYTQISFINTQTGLSTVSYFYWVKDKTEVDIIESPFRNITSTQVAELINNPKGQGIPYAEILDSSSIALVNVTDKLSDDDIILHVDYDVIPNDSVIHSEYALIQEGGITNIPAKIINAFVISFILYILVYIIFKIILLYKLL